MEVEVKILNRLGLHARPAALIAQCSVHFDSEVKLARDNGSVADGKSILSLLMLGASCGTVLTLATTGSDEAEASAAIAGLFEAKFDEE